MFKRPHILGFLVVILISSLLLANTSSPQKIRVQSKEDKARRLWSTSAHAQEKDEPFTHWNEEGSIPLDCAKCHSTPGFRDYLGADGSTPNVVNTAAPIGTTVECAACHANEEKGILHDRTYVIFPSGTEVKGLGPEAMCMECHQGRASTKSVDDAIASSGVTSDDQASSKLKFINVHYFAAAATQFGTVAKGGYQYAGKSYDARFAHIPGYNACQVCHSPHSLKVDLEACNTCHSGVEDPKNIRFYGSFVDYDGDGNITEGIFYEIETIKERLYSTIRAYAKDVIGKPIAYDENAYPYFFNDKNDNGVVDSDEADTSNGYKSFTARLLKASYNLHVSIKDPCSYVHNGKYIVELLYDSIEDLNLKLGNGVLETRISRPSQAQAWQAGRRVQAGRISRNPGLQDGRSLIENPAVSSGNPHFSQFAPAPGHGLVRTDEGHFDGSSEVWRHWDADGAVPATCAKCHSAEGLPYLLQNAKIDKAMPISNGLLCMTCHTSPPRTRFVGPVKFPYGVSEDLGDASNLCLNCHQGRASKKSVDQTIASGPAPYGLVSIHYYASAASFFGSEVHGGYEFSGKTYAGRNIYTNHSGLFTDCVECHIGTKSFNRKQDDSDALFHNVQKPNPADCVPCHGQDIAQPHPGADPANFEFEGIRPAQTPDYDGDGNKKESLQGEIKGLEGALYAQLQASGWGLSSPIVFDDKTYPYFFNDTNGNGEPDLDELGLTNQYKFNAPMLRAAYNFLLSKKEPCGYIHNPRYIAQLLVDSIGHLGGNLKKYTWR
jgi:hypothetical protein